MADDIKAVLERIEKILEKQNKREDKDDKPQKPQKADSLFDAVFNLAKSLPKLIKGDLGAVAGLPSNLVSLFNSVSSPPDKKTPDKKTPDKKTPDKTPDKKTPDKKTPDKKTPASNVTTTFSSIFSSLKNVSKSIFSAGQTFIKNVAQPAPSPEPSSSTESSTETSQQSNAASTVFSKVVNVGQSIFKAGKNFITNAGKIVQPATAASTETSTESSTESSTETSPQGNAVPTVLSKVVNLGQSIFKAGKNFITNAGKIVQPATPTSTLTSTESSTETSTESSTGSSQQGNAVPTVLSRVVNVGKSIFKAGKNFITNAGKTAGEAGEAGAAAGAGIAEAEVGKTPDKKTVANAAPTNLTQNFSSISTILKNVSKSIFDAGKNLIKNAAQNAAVTAAQPTQTGPSPESVSSTESSTGSSQQGNAVPTVLSRIANVGKSIFKAGKNFIKSAGRTAGEAGEGAAGEAGAGAAGAAGEAGAGAAGAAGEAGAGAAGAAAPEAVAALASNPVGWVIAAVAAIVAVTVAMAALPNIIAGWTQSLLDSQRKFSESSGALALVFAKADVYDILRNQKIGDALAPSAGRLEQSREELFTKLTPYIVGIYDLLNNSVGLLADVTTTIIDSVEKIPVGVSALLGPLGAMIELLKLIRADLRPGGEAGAISDWLDKATGEYDRRVRSGEVAREVRIRR